jgi:hypothetical protein
MNDLRIDFAELTKLRGQMARAPEVVSQELLAAVTEADMLLEREVKDTWPVASGISRSSMTHVERVDGLHVEGFVGSSLNYVQPVDLGTKPHFPPVEALIDWVRTKLGITNEKEARGVAFLVARKIAREGTKGAHAFESVLERMRPQLERIFAAAQERIAKRLIDKGGAPSGVA